MYKPIEKQLQDYIDEAYDRMRDEKDLEGFDDSK
jgi:hypothetical protein